MNRKISMKQDSQSISSISQKQLYSQNSCMLYSRHINQLLLINFLTSYILFLNISYKLLCNQKTAKPLSLV